MSKIYQCDVCGRFDTTPDELKTIVALKHQNEGGFVAKYEYGEDVIIMDICPNCLKKLQAFINSESFNDCDVTEKEIEEINSRKG